MPAIAALTAWRHRPDPETFPYDAVVAEFHRVGKHFVSQELLMALSCVRKMLPNPNGPRERRLARFLDTALDKWDGRYENPTYLALEQLSLPGTGEHADDVEHARHWRDRLLSLLVADVMRFEIAAADGWTRKFPELRPDSRTAGKRCRHGLRAIRPALERLGFGFEIDECDPVEAARRVCCAVLRNATAAESRLVQLSALPVSLVHDEYMFLRVLQSYETAFALAGVELAAAVRALADGNGAAAARAINGAARTVGESGPLWSLVGTMQPEAFLRFREFTDGASAIQSRNYKRVESLCRRPEPPRLDSPAYHSVPEVRERVLEGQRDLSEAVASARAAGHLTRDTGLAICEAMQCFEAAIMKWRKTHHSIAAHMLGERRGTGYTAGVAYLDEVRSIPVFESACPVGRAQRPAQPA